MTVRNPKNVAGTLQQSFPVKNHNTQQGATYLYINKDTGFTTIGQSMPNCAIEKNPIGYYVKHVDSMKTATRLKKRFDKNPSLIEKYINPY
jgi:hypothetical protein